MDFHTAKLVTGPTVPANRCAVQAQAEMIEVFQKSAEGGPPFLFVQDEAGDPVGLLGSNDILRQVTETGAGELTQWMNMPVESALHSRIEAPLRSSPNSENAEYTQVSVNGRLLGLITQDDILISWQSIQKTLRNAQGDAVTGLPNRAAFNRHLHAECNRAKRNQHSVAVILIDLDHFKQINDRFGHAAGDSALSTIAAAVRKSLRSYDLVARFGGDELAVICSGCRVGEIDVVVRRIREVVSGLHRKPTARHLLPTISAGAAVAHDPSDISDPDLITEAADRCLYAAKKGGRNQAWKTELISGKPDRPEIIEDGAGRNTEAVMSQQPA